MSKQRRAAKILDVDADRSHQLHSSRRLDINATRTYWIWSFFVTSTQDSANCRAVKAPATQSGGQPGPNMHNGYQISKTS